MYIRALRDEKELFRQAHEWTQEAPAWFRQLDAVFGFKDFETYYKQACEKSQVSFGVFSDELVALITIIERAKGVYEAELSAKRGADPLLIIEATNVIRSAVFDHGCLEGYVWVASRNRMALKICELGGFRRDGIRMYRGVCKGNVVEWVRLSCQGIANERTENHNQYDAKRLTIGDASGAVNEHLRVYDAAGYARYSEPA